MKAFILSVVVFFILASNQAQTTYSFNGGNPGIPSSWTPVANFGSTNAIWEIPSGVNATITSSIIFGDAASSAPNNIRLSLVVKGSLTINSGASITLGAKNSAIVNFNVSGSVVFLGQTTQIVSTANTSNSAIKLITSSGATFTTSNANGIYGAANASIASFAGTVTADINSNTNYIFNRPDEQTLNLPNLNTNFGSITLSGSGEKRMPGFNISMSSDFTIGSDVTVNLAANTNHTLNAKLFLGGIGQFNGTHGGNSSTATIKSNYFSGTGLISVSLSAAPVTLTSFTAKQTTDNKVALAWVTSSESVNKGFSIERQEEGSGKFQSLGFIASKAEGGNSQTTLAYSFKDVTAKNGTNMYRLVQEDLDGKLTYSEVRVVKLSAQSVSNVFPNPSTGAINISRSNDGKKMNIQVLDQSGRVISQVNNITDANYRMNLPQSGIYSIKMMYPETGEQSIQRIVVQK